MLESTIGRLLTVLLAICLVAVACGDDEPASGPSLNWSGRL